MQDHPHRYGPAKVIIVACLAGVGLAVAIWFLAEGLEHQDAQLRQFLGPESDAADLQVEANESGKRTREQNYIDNFRFEDDGAVYVRDAEAPGGERRAHPDDPESWQRETKWMEAELRKWLDVTDVLHPDNHTEQAWKPRDKQWFQFAVMHIADRGAEY